MQTGILVIVTLLVWCSSGSPLCPSCSRLLLGARGRVLQGGDLPGPSPASLHCCWRISAQHPARMQFPWAGPGRSCPAGPSPWVMGTAITAGAILPLEQAGQGCSEPDAAPKLSL